MAQSTRYAGSPWEERAGNLTFPQMTQTEELGQCKESDGGADHDEGRTAGVAENVRKEHQENYAAHHPSKVRGDRHPGLGRPQDPAAGIQNLPPLVITNLALTRAA